MISLCLLKKFLFGCQLEIKEHWKDRRTLYMFRNWTLTWNRFKIYLSLVTLTYLEVEKGSGGTLTIGVRENPVTGILWYARVKFSALANKAIKYSKEGYCRKNLGNFGYRPLRQYWYCSFAGVR